MARGKSRSSSYKAELRKEAEERAEARANRTAEQQLKLLDDKLGKGVGAAKERKRLLAEIEKRG